MARRKRTLARRLFGFGLKLFVLGLFLFLLVLPKLASLQPLRDAMLRGLVPRVHGTIRSTGARLGWFSPIRFDDIQIRDTAGAPVLTIPRLEGDRPLWKLLANRSELGRYRIERPRLDLIHGPDGWNLGRVFFVPGAQPADQPDEREPPDVALGLELVDGALSLRSRDAVRPWRAERINLRLALEPSRLGPDGRPYLVIQPGPLFDAVEVTPQACHDMLAYVAPIVAGTTEVSGTFSIVLDETWRLPLAKLREGTGAGRLLVEQFQVGGGPLVRRLAELLKLPPSARLIEEGSIDFGMARGRIYHHGLQFRLGKLALRTDGSVGLADRSLDLEVQIPLPEKFREDAKIGKLLQGKTIRLPVAGTLDHPEIDAQRLAQTNQDLWLETLREVLDGESVDFSRLFERLGQRRQGDAAPLLPQPEGGRGPLLEGLLDEALGEETPLLDRLRRRRNERLQSRPTP